LMSAGEDRSLPTAEELLDELKKLRRRGVRSLNQQQSFLLLEGLARELTRYEKSSIDRQMKDVLERAAQGLTETWRNAAADLLDFGPDPGPGTVDKRRRLAAKHIDNGPESFYKNHELRLLGELAGQLLILASDHRGEPVDEPEGPAPAAGQDDLDVPKTGANDGPADTEHDQPVALPTSSGDSTATSPPPDEPKPSLSSPPRPRWGRPRLALIVGIALVLVATAVWGLKALNKGEHALARLGVPFLPNNCDATTAELFKPPGASEAESLIYMYVPHQRTADTQHGWSDIFFEPADPKANEHFEAVHLGEVRTFALSYHDLFAESAKEVTARVALPEGAEPVSNSTCVYRKNTYSEGQRQRADPLTSAVGLSIGTVAPNEDVYVTFAARLPKTIPCGYSVVEIYGRIGSESLREPSWTNEAPNIRLPFERKC
jgi:hypothetical protein